MFCGAVFNFACDANCSWDAFFHKTLSLLGCVACIEEHTSQAAMLLKIPLHHVGKPLRQNHARSIRVHVTHLQVTAFPTSVKVTVATEMNYVKGNLIPFEKGCMQLLDAHV